mmetsp:Transcript_30035/g.96091  ORF Transcript_30035/g.96091 Transcript_30035/m.96091 type:complete len:308 (+) Transcript_30035:100-1023(+)
MAVPLLAALLLSYSPSPRPALSSLPAPPPHSTAALQLSSAAAQRSDGVLPLPVSPLPRFAWRTVVTFAANPAAFLVIPLLFRFAPGLDVLGANWATDRMALRHGLVGTAPLLALTLLPLDRIPALSSLREVTTASKTICLYAFGARLVPLRAFAAATLLAGSAAVCEELAFRGALMGGAERLCLQLPLLPPRICALVALAAQALLFGRLHSYTASAAYFAAATVAGCAFGAAFLATRNLAVPVLMHFAVDMVSFLVCHVQVSRAGEAEQRRLIGDASPIATALRGLAGVPPGVPPRADERSAPQQGA